MKIFHQLVHRISPQGLSGNERTSFYTYQLYIWWYFDSLEKVLLHHDVSPQLPPSLEETPPIPSTVLHLKVHSNLNNHSQRKNLNNGINTPATQPVLKTLVKQQLSWSWKILCSKDREIGRQLVLNARILMNKLHLFVHVKRIKTMCRLPSKWTGVRVFWALRRVPPIVSTPVPRNAFNQNENWSQIAVFYNV